MVPVELFITVKAVQPVNNMKNTITSFFSDAEKWIADLVSLAIVLFIIGINVFFIIVAAKLVLKGLVFLITGTA